MLHTASANEIDYTQTPTSDASITPREDKKPIITMNTKTTRLVIGDVNHILETIQALPFEEREQMTKVAQALLEARASELTRIQATRRQVVDSEWGEGIKKAALVCLDNHTNMDTVTFDAIRTIIKPAIAVEDCTLSIGVITANAQNISQRLGLVGSDDRPWYQRWFGM